MILVPFSRCLSRTHPSGTPERTPVANAVGDSARESDHRADITVCSSTAGTCGCASNCSPSPNSARSCRNERSGQGPQRKEHWAETAGSRDRRKATFEWRMKAPADGRNRIDSDLRRRRRVAFRQHEPEAFCSAHAACDTITACRLAHRFLTVGITRRHDPFQSKIPNAARLFTHSAATHLAAPCQKINRNLNPTLRRTRSGSAPPRESGGAGSRPMRSAAS